MEQFLKSVRAPIESFFNNEDGAQVVEYALIIALVSIALALLLASSTNGIGSAFANLVTRLKTCMTGPSCT